MKTTIPANIVHLLKFREVDQQVRPATAGVCGCEMEEKHRKKYLSNASFCSFSRDYPHRAGVSLMFLAFV